MAQTKGFRWGRKNRVKLAKTAVLKAGQHAFRDRKRKKQTFRTLWQVRINAMARMNGTTYSRLIAALHKANIELDRKVLSELATKEPKAFRAVVDNVSKKA